MSSMVLTVRFASQRNFSDLKIAQLSWE